MFIIPNIIFPLSQGSFIFPGIIDTFHREDIYIYFSVEGKIRGEQKQETRKDDETKKRKKKAAVYTRTVSMKSQRDTILGRSFCPKNGAPNGTKQAVF